MKSQYIIFCLFLTSLYSCSQNPKHPQAKLNSGQAMTDQFIAHFADSIDANSINLEKKISLVYQIGDATMYAEQYSQNGTPVLYIQYDNNEGISSLVKKYYLKNDSLLLIKESNRIRKEGTTVYEDKRIYIRNNIAFKKESRSSPTEDALKNSAYIPIKNISDNTQDFAQNLKMLKNAVQGTDKYELVFDDIISSPEETYILLKSKTPNGYTASIVVNDKDSYIDSLIKRPTVYQDKKLNMKWDVIEKEAIYVPVASNLTSARGLNK